MQQTYNLATYVKVIGFDTNRKRTCDFQFRHCDYGPILHRF